MIKKLIFSAFILLLAPLFYAASDSGASKVAKAPLRGDPISGEGKVMVCAGCHGVDGNSVVGQWPTLAGQRESYLFDQLEHIKESFFDDGDGDGDDDVSKIAAPLQPT